MHDDPHPGAASERALEFDRHGRGLESVFQNNPPLPDRQLLVGRSPGEEDQVFFFDFEARVGNPLRQVPIVGQQDQAFAVHIQPPDGIETPRQGQQVANGGAFPLCGQRGDNAARFMKGEGAGLGARGKRRTVDADPVDRRVGGTAEPGAGAVHFHAAFFDQPFAASA